MDLGFLRTNDGSGLFDVQKWTGGFFTYHGSVTISSSSRIISRDAVSIWLSLDLLCGFMRVMCERRLHIFTIGFELVKALLLYIMISKITPARLNTLQPTVELPGTMIDLAIAISIPLRLLHAHRLGFSPRAAGQPHLPYGAAARPPHLLSSHSRVLHRQVL
jgi:hypothetical protein